VRNTGIDRAIDTTSRATRLRDGRRPRFVKPEADGRAAAVRVFARAGVIPLWTNGTLAIVAYQSSGGSFPAP
jgi:hypothetical protein